MERKKRDDFIKMAAEEPSPLSLAVDLKPAGSGDFDFAYRLYQETMKGYSAAYIAWDDNQQKESLALQLSTADVSVISLSGVEVGWLAWMEKDDALFLGHFYVEPQFQNRGIGSIVLSRFLTEADVRHKPVELTVLKNNPARGLYERFGFVVVGDDEMKYHMRREHGI